MLTPIEVGELKALTVEVEKWTRETNRIINDARQHTKADAKLITKKLQLLVKSHD